MRKETPQFAYYEILSKYHADILCIIRILKKFHCISFNLSYHSSGIKVEDPVGILGYGWSILPGLRITRMQFGKVDEHCKLLPLNYNTSIFPRSYWARPNTDEIRVLLSKKTTIVSLLNK